MEFLRKHYEKIVLSVVLVGLAAAAALLPLKVESVREDLKRAILGYERKAIKPLPPLNMSTNEMALKRLEHPPGATFAAPGHNLFNPITWKKGPGGTMFPGEQIGLNVLIITNIVPLYTKIEYKGTRDTGDNVRYEFVITREAATNAAARHSLPLGVFPGGKTETFILKDVKGPKENPTELVVELTDSKNTVSVTKEKPYTEVAGHMADLRYELEKKTFPNQRVQQKLSLSGNTYNIVDIGPADVTLEDAQTKKRTTIHWKAAP